MEKNLRIFPKIRKKTSGKTKFGTKRERKFSPTNFREKY